MDLFAMLQDVPTTTGRVVAVTNGHPYLTLKDAVLVVGDAPPIRLRSIPPMKTLVFELKEPE